ncbi:MAG: hypothetical protein ACLRSD_00360 [Oscillibacter sp.]
MLKAVLMDIDDTLLDFGKCAEQAMRIGFAEWGLPYDDSTYATFTRINDGLWLMIERGSSRRSSSSSSAGTASLTRSGSGPTALHLSSAFWTFSMKRPSPSTARRRSAAISRTNTSSARRATPFTTSSSTG